MNDRRLRPASIRRRNGTDWLKSAVAWSLTLTAAWLFPRHPGRWRTIMDLSEFDPATTYRRPWNVGQRVGAKRALEGHGNTRAVQIFWEYQGREHRELSWVDVECSHACGRAPRSELFGSFGSRGVRFRAQADSAPIPTVPSWCPFRPISLSLSLSLCEWLGWRLTFLGEREWLNISLRQYTPERLFPRRALLWAR